MNYPQNEDIKLNFIVKGEGEPLILLHGFASSLQSYAHLIEPLSKRYRVYALDLKGFGASPKPRDDKYSVYDQMVLVRQFMRDQNISNPIMIGHSLGGSVVLSLALTGEKIKKMVLLDVAAYRQKRPYLLDLMQIPLLGKIGFYLLPAHYKVLEGYKFAYYDDSKIPKQMVDTLAKYMQMENAKYAFVRANDALIPDDIDAIEKRYGEIDIPTLILWGYDDVVIRRDKGYRLHRDISGSKLVVIPECGHLPQEEKPEETLKYILDFL